MLIDSVRNFVLAPIRALIVSMVVLMVACFLLSLPVLALVVYFRYLA